MVKINHCPKCGHKLDDGNNICPNCNFNIENIFDGINVQEVGIMDNEKINVNPGDEIVIVVPDNDDDEIVIDLDELGIDVENLDENVNIVIQVEGEDMDDDIELYDEDDELEPNEWYFDDDPYGIVYYEFPDFDED